jgi:acyl carrier protein
MSADLPISPATGDTTDERLRALLRDTLGLAPGQAERFKADTPLFGALPELDSMAVAELLTAIEDRFSVIIDDDDVDGETFETFGSLAAFVASKVSYRR